MKININLILPRVTDELIKTYSSIYKENEKVKAYSINEDTLEIVEGEGYIASDESYNYHNNYDDSENTLWFEHKYWNREDWNGTWWTPSFAKAKEEQKRLLKEAIDQLAQEQYKFQQMHSIQ